VDQPPAASFTAFVSLHSQTPRAIETEIGAALCAIGEGKDFDFEFIDQVSNLSSFSLNCCFYEIPLFIQKVRDGYFKL